VSKNITAFVGLEVHKDSTAIAAAEAGRETPRFLGTVGPDLGQLLGNPRRCSWCTRQAPAGMDWPGSCSCTSRSNDNLRLVDLRRLAHSRRVLGILGRCREAEYRLQMDMVA
jgi:hypothetical protein